MYVCSVIVTLFKRRKIEISGQSSSDSKGHAGHMTENLPHSPVICLENRSVSLISLTPNQNSKSDFFPKSTNNVSTHFLACSTSCFQTEQTREKKKKSNNS